MTPCRPCSTKRHGPVILGTGDCSGCLAVYYAARAESQHRLSSIDDHIARRLLSYVWPED